MPRLQHVATGENPTAYRSELPQIQSDASAEATEVSRIAEESRSTTDPACLNPPASLLTTEIPAQERHIRLDELVSAISAIEARKDEAVLQSQPLGIALSAANVDVAAEEVWDEIQKQRERTVRLRSTRNSLAGKPRQLRLKIGIAIACLLVTLAALYILMNDFFRVH